VLGDRAPNVETLLAAAPDLIVRGAPADEPPGRQTDMADHPMVRRFWGERTVVFAQRFYLCGTPFSADGALELRRALRQAQARARRLPPPGAPVTP
jgi:iron complex transport system substrate-binding protein